MGEPETADDKSLVHIVFSWSIDDVLNKDLFKFKVKQIPELFSSVTQYMDSFILPLVEETHADLCSSMETVSLAPTYPIDFTDICNDPKKPVCTVVMNAMGCSENGFEPYEQSGGLIAITDVRPRCPADLNRPKLSYIIAFIQHVKQTQNKDEYELQIRLSKPFSSELYLMDVQTTFVVFLTNITTNLRIWKALNLQLGEGSFNIIKSVLQTDPRLCQNCAVCFQRERNWIEATTTGAFIRSLDLNKSQEEAVFNCTTLKECYHKDTVKLIWGPPGTGKTKTIASFLFAMFKTKTRVVTCTPTNIAVVEVTKRLLKLALKSLEYGTYGLGDIVLFGNGRRMKIQEHDDLFDVFLDFRAHMLNKCFQPSSGWLFCLESIICLLENPEEQYCVFLQKKRQNNGDRPYGDLEEQHLLDEIYGGSHACSQDTEARTRTQNFKRRTWIKVVEKNLRAGKNKHLRDSGKQEKFVPEHEQSHLPCDVNPTFEEFVTREFHFLRSRIKFFATVLFTHLPTSSVSLKAVKNMNHCLSMLDNLCLSSVGGGVSISGSEGMKMESLKTLKVLRERFDLPNLIGEYNIKRFCLENGRLFFCTASSSVRLFTDGPRLLKIAVIDEAAQLKECESLIPLQLPGLHHAILIGDEQQLPAMVKSKISEKAAFGRSLFERLVLLGHERHLLNVQYRMHPSISLFPNMEFYQKRILDAPSVVERDCPVHILSGKMFGSYSFIDVSYGEETLGDGHSLKNSVEVAVVCEIVCKLVREVCHSRKRITVGIISPYKAQVHAINQKLQETNVIETNSTVSVSVRSIDGFQGVEEDVIIISTVRCNVHGSVGFLSDCRRTNVALTRARYCLWIIGNGATLINSDSVWKNVVIDAKTRQCYFDAAWDDTLAYAIASALVELDHPHTLVHVNSLLFRRSRWKVVFSEHFQQSMARIEKLTLRKKVLSLVSNLSTGWRKHLEQRYISFKDGMPHLLEYIKVDEKLFLIWNVDIIEDNSSYVQFLNICDVLPWFEIPKLVVDLNTIFSTYSADHLSCCRFRCSEGELEVPMTWPVDTYARESILNAPNSLELLANKFSVLKLKH